MPRRPPRRFAGARPRRRVPALVLAFLLGWGLTGAAAAAQPGVGAAGQPAATGGQPGAALTARPAQPVAGAPTATAARSDPSLLRAAGTAPVAVLVRLDYDPVASYGGGLPGLPATSPEVTGRPLSDEPEAVRAYGRYVASVERRVVERIRRAVPEARVLRSYRVAFGGLALLLPANRARDLLSVPGVVAVMEDDLLRPMTNVTPTFLRATRVWPALGGPRLAGSTVVIGLLDTGIWPEHPSLRDRGLPPFRGTVSGCAFGDGTDPDLGPAFACNRKVVAARAFLDGYTSLLPVGPGEFCARPGPPTGEPRPCSARDADGHGTQSATIAAGAVTRGARTFGIPRGTVAGMAPGARVVAYRVCLAGGCLAQDVVAAVEQAILDGVDVLNAGMGPFGPPRSDPVALAFLDAFAAGIVVTAPAGNDGPGPGTVSDPGPWALVVAAGTSPRRYATSLVATAPGGAVLEVEGLSVSGALARPTEVVRAEDLPGYRDPRCRSPLPRSAAGLVVACRAGGVGPVAKTANAARGGAAGVVIYRLGDREVWGTDTSGLPAVHLSGPEGGELLSFLDRHPGSRAQWLPGLPSRTAADVLAPFSSRGPAGEFLKPDLTAPGVQVLAGTAPPSGSPPRSFRLVEGSSAASAHVAGIAALVRAAHPDWPPGRVRSALVTSAAGDVRLAGTGGPAGTRGDVGSGGPAGPLDGGAGSVRANRAVSPTLALDLTAREAVAAMQGPARPVDLNLPTIQAGAVGPGTPGASGEPGVVTAVRVVRNVSDRPQTLQAEVPEDRAGSVTVAPDRFSLAPGEAIALTFRMRPPVPGEATGTWVTLVPLDPRSTPVRIAVVLPAPPAPTLPPPRTE